MSEDKKEEKDDKIFKIKELPVAKSEDKKEVVVTDKRTFTSKYNAFKHGKYTDLPAMCDQCKFGENEEVGGTGQCPKYEAGSACIVRDDIKKMVEKYDTRKLDDLKAMADIQLKALTETGVFTDFISKMDGNLPDKHSLAVINTWIKLGQFVKELHGFTKITAKESRTKSDKDMITELFTREVSVERDGS